MPPHISSLTPFHCKHLPPHPDLVNVGDSSVRGRGIRLDSLSLYFNILLPWSVRRELCALLVGIAASARPQEFCTFSNILKDASGASLIYVEIMGSSRASVMCGSAGKGLNVQ